MPGFSPPTKLKTDPHKSVKIILKRYSLDDIFDDVLNWMELDTYLPSSLKKQFISSFFEFDDNSVNIHFGDVDLNDPVSWGEENPDLPLPPDQFFIFLSKAIKADEKRNAKRSSYEF